MKVPFGLAQAPAYFQELMTGILKDFPVAIAYLDDIIIFSKTTQEHLSHIRMVFEKLKSANLSMKKSKCSFFFKEIQYLGHILSATGIRPLPPILHYPNLEKKYIVYTDTSGNACSTQLSQEHHSTEFPVAFLSHALTETQWKWSTTEQEAYGIYYAITK